MGQGRGPRPGSLLPTQCHTKCVGGGVWSTDTPAFWQQVSNSESGNYQLFLLSPWSPQMLGKPLHRLPPVPMLRRPRNRSLQGQESGPLTTAQPPTPSLFWNSRRWVSHCYHHCDTHWSGSLWPHNMKKLSFWEAFPLDYQRLGSSPTAIALSFTHL